VSDAFIAEQFDILRRIADRGRNLSLPAGDQDGGDSAQLDLWQHMLDEIERTRAAVEEGLT
jgi:hypothetical protein